MSGIEPIPCCCEDGLHPCCIECARKIVCRNCPECPPTCDDPCGFGGGLGGPEKDPCNPANPEDFPTATYRVTLRTCAKSEEECQEWFDGVVGSRWEQGPQGSCDPDESSVTFYPDMVCEFGAWSEPEVPGGWPCEEKDDECKKCCNTYGCAQCGMYLTGSTISNCDDDCAAPPTCSNAECCGPPPGSRLCCCVTVTNGETTGYSCIEVAGGCPAPTGDPHNGTLCGEVSNCDNCTNCTTPPGVSIACHGGGGYYPFCCDQNGNFTGNTFLDGSFYCSDLLVDPEEGQYFCENGYRGYLESILGGGFFPGGCGGSCCTADPGGCSGFCQGEDCTASRAGLCGCNRDSSDSLLDLTKGYVYGDNGEVNVNYLFIFGYGYQFINEN